MAKVPLAQKVALVAVKSLWESLDIAWQAVVLPVDEDELTTVSEMQPEYGDAMEAYKEFCRRAHSCPQWLQIRNNLGPPLNSRPWPSRLSFYLAAALPTRFGFIQRRELLATISTRDRLVAATVAFREYPPVTQYQVSCGA